MAQMHTPEPKIGSRAHPFSLLGVDGKTHTLQSCRGPLGVLVVFICNHCPYVQALRDRLAADMKDIQKTGVGVVAICSNDPADYPEDSYENLRKQAKAWGFTFPYLHDESQLVARTYGAVCTPDFFGYNANLELHYRGRLDPAQRGPRTPDMKRELVDAMAQIARTGKTSAQQVPSMGCSIKWRDIR
ncbi:MAG TPA: thioredoxin family protein [Candidatus Saccharimonadia bacterium]|nr:thioredoxin family protein [Candidatus Saccharimonadia bacterium]